MKILSTFLLLAGALFMGCGNDSSSSGKSEPASSSGNLLTAPVDYIGAAGKAQRSAEKTADAASLNQAVQLFQVQEGRFPKDLNELVTQKYLPRIPAPPYKMKFVYDATKGKVTVVPE